MKQQETRKGRQGLEEVDTYDLLDKLTPSKRRRCRGGTKACGRACCDSAQLVTIELDAHVATAVSRAADYVNGRHQRTAEVQRAARAVEQEVQRQLRSQP
jgi:hypothetical protein